MRKLKTIKSEKNLLNWEQNRNGVPLYENCNETILQNLSRKTYKCFFISLLKQFKNHNRASFTDDWVKYCDKAAKQISKYLVKNFKLSEENAQRIAHKFRGNVGEIVAEYIFTELDTHIDRSTYKPVDPENERFLDATAKAKDDIQMLIQVKNYSGEVNKEPFLKLAMEAMIYLYNNKKKAAEFLSRKRALLLTFTDKKYTPFEKDYAKVVETVGPEEIDNKLLKDRDTRIDMLTCILNNIGTLS